MKRFFSLFLLLNLSIFSFSQSYWQQEVNYKIQVKLNDKEHALTAFEEFEYINHSPNDLSEIYIHLWPNAYRNGQTALAKQLYANNNSKLKFGKEKDRGWIDSLDFKVNGQAVKWEYDEKHIDICKITLHETLKSGQKIIISTPFKVKIPSGKISRLGHIEQSYQITQWYPKPAVYDKNGWNQMPYLNQGEFYSEYGSFDVSITLPKNYVVGATGDLQTATELEFLEEKLKMTNEKLNYKQLSQKISDRDKEKNAFPISDSIYKTIRYTQSKVHDFAWFADKRFFVQKGEVELPTSKEKVTTWALFTYQNSYLWQKAINYINDGIYYYSLWNGDYPYKQATAVDGTISAGGGMEYPNVTVIGNVGSEMELETVIVHEVGHNWFYGILGSNERVHGWMDEGLNTLNEMRYIQTKYPQNKELSETILGGKFHFNDLNHHDSGDMGYRMMAMLSQDQPIETTSTDFSSINYGLIMYQKTGLVFHYLKAVLGDELFDKSMQIYFDTWKFKHPQPEDLKNCLEKASGKDLTWLFKDLIQTTKHLDFKIKKVKETENGTKITLKNKGQFKAPIVITAFAGSEKHEIVSEAFSKTITLTTPMKNISKVLIDENKQIPEMFRNNNSWDKRRLFNKVEPCKFEFLIGDHEANRNNHFWSPAIAGNANDRLMLGFAFHNFGIPFKKFQYFVAPMYSFGRQNLAGIAEINITLLPANILKLSRFGVSSKTFSTSDYYERGGSYYVGVSPYWFTKINHRKKDISHTILLQSIYRYDQNIRDNGISYFAPIGFGVKDDYTHHAGGFFQHSFKISKADFSFGTNARIEYLNNLENDDQVFRGALEINSSYKYLKNKMKRQIELRVFLGKIWDYTNSNYNLRNLDYSYAMAGANGMQDLFLEDYLFDRSTNGLSNYSQRMDNMGGFKSTSSLGTTYNYLTSFNLYVQLPVKPNVLGIFSDYGIYYTPSKIESMYNIGFGFRLGKVVGIYFPVIMSKNMELSFPTKEYVSRIRFTVKLNFVNKPFQLSSLF